MIRFHILPTLILVLITAFSSCSNSSITINGEEVETQLIYNEDFNEHINNWTTEQREGGTVKLLGNKMDIDDANGCTVWFNQELTGNIMIEYDAIVIDNGGKNDRVSDLNCFWMARDSENTHFFANSTTRGGKFQNYHNLKLYYVGLGGHNNTKTRFRRYAGGGERPCLPEHDLSDEQYLITANQPNTIRLIVYNGQVQYYRNNQLIYDFYDEHPYTNGYFGIRTYKNHMTVDNFKVFKLLNNE